MIAILIVGCFVAVYRIWTGLASNGEKLVFALLAAIFLVIEGLILVEGKRLLPFSRYYAQAGVLALPWVLWGVRAVSSRLYRILVPVAVVGLAGFFLFFASKGRIPGTSLHRTTCAARWAASLIREDWPRFSREPGPVDPFDTATARDVRLEEYVVPQRPSIGVERPWILPWRLRARIYPGYGPLDYILHEEGRPLGAPCASLEPMATETFGGRVYTLYRVPGHAVSDLPAGEVAE